MLLDSTQSEKLGLLEGDEPFWRAALFAQCGRETFQQLHRQLARPIRHEQAFREPIDVAARCRPQYRFPRCSRGGPACIGPFAGGHLVARGESLLDPLVTTRILERIRHSEADDELAGLTDQERKILALIADGLTNRQIGEQMFLAEKTVKNYVSNLLSKLGMSRRTEAAAYAARLSERKHRLTDS